jgi:hypothetical protein
MPGRGPIIGTESETIRVRLDGSRHHRRQELPRLCRMGIHLFEREHLPLRPSFAGRLSQAFCHLDRLHRQVSGSKGP